MACHEVTGTICWDEPAKGPVVFAKPIANNETPDTSPYIMLAPAWDSAGDPGAPWTLPVFTGWAYKNSWAGTSVADSSTRWAFESVEFTGSYLAGLDITLQFETEEDIVYRLPLVGYNPAGPHKIYTPNDRLTGIVVSRNTLSSSPADQVYF